MVKEQSIQDKIVKYIESIGGVPIVQTEYGIYARMGVPDILACVKGRFVAIEVKRPKQKPRPTQLAWLDAIERAGGVAFWATSVEEVQDKIKEL